MMGSIRTSDACIAVLLQVVLPAFASRYAVVSPLIPPPMTHTSASVSSDNLGYLAMQANTYVVGECLHCQYQSILISDQGHRGHRKSKFGASL